MSYCIRMRVLWYSNDFNFNKPRHARQNMSFKTTAIFTTSCTRQCRHRTRGTPGILVCFHRDSRTDVLQAASVRRCFRNATWQALLGVADVVHFRMCLDGLVIKDWCVDPLCITSSCPHTPRIGK